jgi:putative transcriptional regulator
MRIDFKMEQLLEERGHTLYWLAKELGVDYTTIHRFKSGKAAGVTFDLLARMCEALGCKPGDLLVLVDEKTDDKKRAKSKS